MTSLNLLRTYFGNASYRYGSVLRHYLVFECPFGDSSADNVALKMVALRCYSPQKK